jgi:hypothetical protein
MLITCSNDRLQILNVSCVVYCFSCDVCQHRHLKGPGQIDDKTVSVRTNNGDTEGYASRVVKVRRRSRSGEGFVGDELSHARMTIILKVNKEWQKCFTNFEPKH